MTSSPATARPHAGIPAWGYPMLVAGLTFLAFTPALQAEFVDWDDDVNFLHNPHYRGLGLENLRWAFTTRLMGPWQPLSWISLGLDYEIWGMDARGYHLTNLLLHAAGAVMVYFVGLELLQRFGPTAGVRRTRAAAAAGALLFSVHPLRVESVAWVTERRDVLSGVFFFASAWLWLRSHGEATSRRTRRRRAAVALFALSLLAKASGMMLPFVLLLLLAWPLRSLSVAPGRIRLAGSDLRGLVPFFGIAAVAGWIAILGQREAGAMLDLASHDLWARTRIAAYGLCFYVYKTLLPLDLSPIYELAEPFAAVPHRFWAHVLAVPAGLAAVAALGRRWPAVTVATFSYVLLALPVSGLAQSGGQLAADRYSYLPCVPFALLGAAAVARWRHALPVAALAVLVLGVTTFGQTRVWRNSLTLWTHALRVQPDSPRAHYNLGVVLLRARDLAGAERHFRTAVAAWPWYAHAHNNLAVTLYEQGRVAEAVAHWRRFLELAPQDPKAPAVREALGRLEESREGRRKR